MEERKKKQKSGGTGLSGRGSSRIISSGGVVFKKLDNQILWLVAKTTPSVLYPKPWWRLPKGWLDDEDGGINPGQLTRGEKKVSEMDFKKTAEREVAEEAGVKAKIINKAGVEKFFYTSKEGIRIFKLVYFYLMEWVSDLPGGPGFETAEVKWLPYFEARKQLTQSGERKILDKAKELLDSGISSKS